MRCGVLLLGVELITSPTAGGRPIPLQVDAKATLGLGGVTVVLGAVMAAMGLFSYLRVPSSLVVLQVVPFLVLAVGADNIFIFVLEYQVSAPIPGHLRGVLSFPHPATWFTIHAEHSAFHSLCPACAPVLAVRQPHACGEGGHTARWSPSWHAAVWYSVMESLLLVNTEDPSDPWGKCATDSPKHTQQSSGPALRRGPCDRAVSVGSIPTGEGLWVMAWWG